MPSKNFGFKGVSLKAELYQEVEKFVKEGTNYRSVAEFVSEAIRLRLEKVQKVEA